MVCRNKDRGMAAQKDIQEQAGNQVIKKIYHNVSLVVFILTMSK